MLRNINVSLLLVFLVLGSTSFAADVEWLTDFDKAKELAAEKELPILVNFSGSDWCRWCVKLSDEVLTHDEFAEYASENLVLFVADFPRFSEQDEDEAAQNQELADTYGIRGFPTVLLLDAEGNLLAQTGYQQGGPEAYVTHLQGLLERSRLKTAE